MLIILKKNVKKIAFHNFRSETTGMRKKKEKKGPKNLLMRKVKEGSPIEEDYLIAYMQDI